MKKTLALILAIALCLSLCACSGNGGQETTATTEGSSETTAATTATTAAPTEAAPAMYQIGDTARTDIVEVVLNDVSFADTYSVCTAQEGYTFIVVNYSIKNIGKTELGFFPTFHRSRSIIPSSIVGVDYNDGYIFYVDDVVGSDGQTYYYSVFADPDDTDLDDLKPLSEAVTFEAAICVPNQVIEDTAAPLLIKFNLLNEAGETVVAIFSIR